MRETPRPAASATESTAFAGVRLAIPSAWIAFALAAAAYVGLTLATLWPDTPVDDAFITFHYARHLAQGDGLVLNPGEPVEGYTSLTWTVAMAAFHALGLPLELWARLVGMLLGLATLASLARARPDAWLALALTATCQPLLYHAINGLETALATFLVTALCTLPDHGPRSRAHLVVAGLLVWTRPEGALCVAIWGLVRALLEPAFGLPRLLRLGACALLAAGLQVGFRVVHYHAWIANSARAKLAPIAFAWPEGLSDLGAALFWCGGLGIVPLLAVWGTWGARGARAHDPEARRTLSLAAFFILAGPALAVGGGDSFPLWRFYVPLLPGLFLLAGDGFRAAGAALPAGRRLPLVVVSFALCAALSLQHLRGLREVRTQGDWARHFTAIGRALDRAFDPPTTVALTAAGAIPYYSGLRALDMLGLTDPHIARAPFDDSYRYPGHQRHDGRYVLDRRPELILLANGPIATAPGAPFPWHKVRIYERDVAEDPRLKADYDLIQLPLPDGRAFQLFARKDFISARR